MKKLFSTLTIILILGFALAESVFAVGQITKPIVIEDVLREQTVTATLKLLGEPEKEVAYKLEANGDIKDWTKFYEIGDVELTNPITEITIPAGAYLDATATFTIPAGTPNGEYKGEVLVATIPIPLEKDIGAEEENKEENIASVRLKVGRAVTITVTDKEIIGADTTVIPVSYDIRKGKPLQIRIIHENTGNISIKPDIKLTIKKEGETVFTAIFPYPAGAEAVAPREKKELPLIEWSGTSDSGIYRAEVETSLGGKAVETEDFKFTVGFISADGFLNMIAAVGGGNTTAGWFAIGGALIVIAGVLYAISRKRRLRAD